MPWDMGSLNIPGSLNVFRVLARPGLCLPHASISTFNDLPVPLNQAFAGHGGENRGRQIDIKAVVLDKDDCFAKPGGNEVLEDYKVSCLTLFSLDASSLGLQGIVDAPLVPVDEASCNSYSSNLASPDLSTSLTWPRIPFHHTSWLTPCLAALCALSSHLPGAPPSHCLQHGRLGLRSHAGTVPRLSRRHGRSSPLSRCEEAELRR